MIGLKQKMQKKRSVFDWVSQQLCYNLFISVLHYNEYIIYKYRLGKQANKPF